MTIEFRNVRAAYGNGENVLEDVSFTIGKGEFVAFVGPNGSGKSLIMRLVRGLEQPNAGQIIIDGTPTTGFKAGQLARRVGFLFQNPDEQMCADTVHDEIYFGLRAVGGFGTYVDEDGNPIDADSAEASEADERAGESAEIRRDRGLRTANRVDALIERFDLDPEANPLAISRGARKLVALASILVLDAPIVVLDDPTAGLDFRECVKAFEAIRAMRKNGTTVLMACHDMEVVADFAERVIAMSDGRVIDDGPTFEVLRNLHTLEVARLIPPQIIDVSLALEYMQPELAGYPVTRANTLNEMQSAIEASCGSPRIPGILSADSGYSTRFGAPGAQELESGSIDSYLAKLETVEDGPGGGLAPRGRILSQARHFSGVSSIEGDELGDLNEGSDDVWPDDVWGESAWADDNWALNVKNIDAVAGSDELEKADEADADGKIGKHGSLVDSEEADEAEEADSTEDSELEDADGDISEEAPDASDASEDAEETDGSEEADGSEAIDEEVDTEKPDEEVDTEDKDAASEPEVADGVADSEDAEPPETLDDEDATDVSEDAEEQQDGGCDE